MANLQKVPYITSKKQEKHALVIPMTYPTQDLSNEEFRVLKELSRAVDSMNKVFCRQQHKQGLELYKTLRELEENEQDLQKKELLKNFNLIFCARNGPYNHTDGLTQKFPLKEIPQELKEFEELLLSTKASKGMGLYPQGFSEKDFETLPKSSKNRVNSLVIKEGEEFKVVVNEEYFAQELETAITALQKAQEILVEASFPYAQELLVYVKAKEQELRSGSVSDREASSKAWLNNHSRIDFVLSTAIETYIDRIKGVRGEVDSGVFIINKEFQGFCDRFTKLLPSLEQRAPWTHKKVIHEENIPKLRFVDVITWSGGYDAFPATVMAQSLPNEQSFRERYGSVNLVFANVQEAISKSNKSFMKQFIPQEEYQLYGEHLGHINILMTAAHEIGHASGGVTIKEDPGEFFGSEYSVMEEARAELFSLWTLPLLVEEGEITPQEEMAGYYAMTLTMISALQQEPNDHSGSRNIMLHYFLEQGAVTEETKNDLPVFRVNKEKIRKATKELLQIIGDIRATGDKKGLKELRDKYLRTERREEFEKYLKELPQGRLLVFPEIKEEEGKLVVKEVEDFRKQQRVLDAYI